MRITINEYQPGFESIVASCIHETYAETKADILRLRLKDPDIKMPSMMIRQNDIIRIDNGAITTGDMYIHRCRPDGDVYEIRALSIPASGTSKKSMSWQNIHLYQILKQKADEMSLDLSTYGVENIFYRYVPQENESDMGFILKICRREGLQVIIYDKRLIIYSEKHIESIEPSGTIELYGDNDYIYSDQSNSMYKTCIVNGGGYSATFTDATVNTSNILSEIETYVESDSQALRYAKSFLRGENRSKKGGSFVMPIDKSYAAGSVCYLRRPGTSDKKIILTRVRYDYVNKKMKVFFNDVFLEGY